MFKTRCKCEGKVCNVIIDSGSTDNLVPEEMVKKLRLEKKKHPNPYRIAWVQNDKKLLVNEQCMVKFKIGGYFDEILCDIIPMDVCHILLGRPWQYDRKALHDGYNNVYRITKDGKRHLLKPLKEDSVQVCSNARVCLADSRKFFEGMRHEKVCFVLILKTNIENVGDVSREIADLLQEFGDIVLDNVLEGFPPMRKINR